MRVCRFTTRGRPKTCGVCGRLASGAYVPACGCVGESLQVGVSECVPWVPLWGGAVTPTLGSWLEMVASRGPWLAGEQRLWDQRHL